MLPRSPQGYPCGATAKTSQSLDRLAAWPVFASDETRIPEPIQLIEQERVIQFLGRRLIPRGDTRDLYVPNDRHQSPERNGHVAMDDLAMIDVELQLEIGKASSPITVSASLKSFR